MANKRLLLVEDDRALADLVTFHLERSGYDVTRTGDGEEALILVDEVKPDVVLLDWMIEGVSGIEVCRRLRRRSSTANVPIMMLTARGEEVRSYPRTRDRRRRLRDQALQSARVGRPRRRGASPRSTRACRRATRLCGYRDGRRCASGSPRRAACSSRPHGVSPAQAFPGASRARLFARAPARRRVVARPGHRRSYGRRACQASAPGAQTGRTVRSDPHRSVRRLFPRQRGLSFNETARRLGRAVREFRFELADVRAVT